MYVCMYTYVFVCVYPFGSKLPIGSIILFFKNLLPSCEGAYIIATERNAVHIGLCAAWKAFGPCRLYGRVQRDLVLMG